MTTHSRKISNSACFGSKTKNEEEEVEEGEEDKVKGEEKEGERAEKIEDASGPLSHEEGECKRKCGRLGG